jgi:hypothetical protein
MPRLRTVKTSSGSKAVQVVEYVNRKTVILSHIGSAKSDEELLELKKAGQDWILRNNKQLSFFSLLEDESDEVKPSSLVALDKCSYLGFTYQLFYDVFSDILLKFKFHLLSSNYKKLLNDLVIARIAFPTSKIESLEFLEQYFAIKHNYRTLARAIPHFEGLKDEIESKIITVAKKHFNFNFSLVFYDLTTLYFESFETDDLRRIGFSKDNKASQPQIMIGLLVNNSGFPVSYQVFPGNKFEGHSLMPSILQLRKKYKIEQMTVVADSAMISDKNIQFLKEEKLHYIVGARTANLPMQMIEEISGQLNHEDEATIKIPQANKGDLICHFSKKRYQKERREMEKQIQKAEFILKTPSAAEIIKRTKFLKGKSPSYELNLDLIKKATLLLGIKGYYTNLTS